MGGFTVSDNGILLGKRQFLYFKEQQAVRVEDWNFSLPPGFKMIAGGSANPLQTQISLYRDAEKVAHLLLTHRRMDSDLCVQAVSSEVSLEILSSPRLVRVSEKQ